MTGDKKFTAGKTLVLQCLIVVMAVLLIDFVLNMNFSMNVTGVECQSGWCNRK